MSRDDRFSSYQGQGSWPEKSALYTKHCYGSKKTFPKKVWDFYKPILDQYKGDWAKAVLNSYTHESFAYKDTNGCLLTNSEVIEEFGGYIYYLKEAIKWRVDNVGGTKGIVYRGMVVPTDVDFLFKMKNRMFVWPNFTSASHSEAVARGFAKHKGGPGKTKMLFKIDTSGTGISWVVDIADVSAFPREQECLFYPYTGFRIKDVHCERDLVVVTAKTFDSKLYFNHWLQKIEWTRFGFGENGKRTVLALCFYKSDDITRCASSVALVPAFNTCASGWCSRHSVSEFVGQMEKQWGEHKYLYCATTGAGSCAGFFVDGGTLGSAQAYTYDKDPNVIKTWVSEKHDEGYSLTTWVVLADHTLAVMTKNPKGGIWGSNGSCHQSYAWGKSWKEWEEWVAAKYKEGYIITDFNYNNNRYSCVMTKLPQAQSWMSFKEWPKAWIEEQWSSGKTITHILNDGHTEFPWKLVCTKDVGTANQWATGLGTQ